MTPRQLGAIAILVLVVPALGGTASADPAEEKRAEAARIQRQLEQEAAELSVTAEQYNQAQIRLEAVRAKVAKAQSDLSQADQRMQLVKGRLSQAAVMAYVHGGSNSVLSVLARSENDDLVRRRQYLRITAADQRRIIGELHQAREDLTSMRSRLTAEESAADEVADDAAAAKRAAGDAESAQRAALGRVKGELAGLVAAEQDRRDAAAAGPVGSQRAAAPAGAPAKKAAPAKPAAPTGPPPPVGKGAAAAVEEAKRQIGKPYRYGGSGPDSFDCSGLTAWAWRAAGVRLSHSALAQYHETARVPVDAVQPGDLLFFGPSVSGIHHNAIYVGGGQMIEASQTGVPIRYRGWRAKDLVGAGRPG